MISLQEDHINPEAVEVHYQTPEELKLQNSAEPKVVVHDDDIDSVPMEINNPPVSPNRIDPLPPVETPNHLDVPVAPAPAEAPGEHEYNISNPVDAIKRRYDSVIIAKDGNDYYADANDVQKCAELRNESMIETINGIISVNESSGLNADNFSIIVSESMNENVIDILKESNIRIIDESVSNNKIVKTIIDTTNQFLLDNGVGSIRLKSYKNKKIGMINDVRISLIDTVGTAYSINSALTTLSNNKNKLQNIINNNNDFVVTNIKFSNHKGVTQYTWAGIIPEIIFTVKEN